jgi:hypothetical protein
LFCWLFIPNYLWEPIRAMLHTFSLPVPSHRHMLLSDSNELIRSYKWNMGSRCMLEIKVCWFNEDIFSLYLWNVGRFCCLILKYNIVHHRNHCVHHCYHRNNSSFFILTKHINDRICYFSKVLKSTISYTDLPMEKKCFW